MVVIPVSRLFGVSGGDAIRLLKRFRKTLGQIFKLVTQVPIDLLFRGFFGEMPVHQYGDYGI